MFSVQHDGQPKVETAAHLFSDMIYQNKDALSAGIIVAGWDKQKGGTVYNVPLGGGVFQQPWAIGGEWKKKLHLIVILAHMYLSGSGSAYIYGFCDSQWKEGWGKEETLEFVRNGALDEGALIIGLVFNVASFVLVTALSLAMSRDGSSGGTIRMADISEKGVERHFVPGNNLPVLSAKIV
jgi:20S proteasome subunit beta 1